MRSLKTSLGSSELEQQQPLALLGAAALLSLALELLPGVGLLAYPFRLLITIVHELSHGLAALLTGGSFINFVVFSDGAGLATTAGGWRLLVIPAGYLGAGLFAATLIVLGRHYRRARITLGVLGGLLLLLSLRYATPSLFSDHPLGGLLALVAGVLIGACFIWVARKASQGLIFFLLNLIAMQAGLTAFSDLVDLIGLSSLSGSNDARSMAAITFLPAVVWALLWALVTLALILGALWRTWLRPGRS